MESPKSAQPPARYRYRYRRTTPSSVNPEWPWSVTSTSGALDYFLIGFRPEGAPLHSRVCGVVTTHIIKIH
jgi:hypothetical protein